MRANPRTRGNPGGGCRVSHRFLMDSLIETDQLMASIWAVASDKAASSNGWMPASSAAAC